MTISYYAISPLGQDDPKPEGLFYKEETDDEFRLIGLNRQTGEWEEMPDLIDYFVGEGSGDEGIPVSEEEAAKTAESFGVNLP